MRVVYRQTWRPRGIQPGELVRTIPLAPGQKERISTKIQQRTKVSRQTEDKASSETTEESTTQVKDSSEIVRDATKTNKWQVDVKASLSGGFLGLFDSDLSSSTGHTEDSANSSKDTKSRLTDAMQKAARVSRQETRVQVNTEREDSFEAERSSEITNPNQEIAVTCFYETVQQIYTVNTALEGVEPVLFVAERVPRPEELTTGWIRRHDWILDRALLDDSFRDALNAVSTQDPDFIKAIDAPALGLDEVARLSLVLDKAETSLASIQLLPGHVANTYEATLNAYQSAAQRARARLEHVQQLLSRTQRLIEHIADNILYYCRAIWAQEDRDRRMMRYASHRFPTRFQSIINTQNVETDPLTGDTIYTGTWVPDPTSWRPLSDLIHPDGPIAYAGNYAVYRLRCSGATAGLSRVIRVAMQAYCDPAVPTIRVEPPDRAAAINLSVAIDDEHSYTYRLRIAAAPAPPPPAASSSPRKQE